MKKCTSSAHTLWNVNTEYHSTTSTSLKKYDELVANPNIRKTKIKARDLETEISKLQQESGYPYVVNIDTANRPNPVDGKIIMSNLCSEILQVQEPSFDQRCPRICSNGNRRLL